MTEHRKVELLAPCGNFDCVKAAINAGADAVYLGGQLFSARAYASNFDVQELEQVCDLCHSYSVKVYVTVNTLYKDTEFERLIHFIDGLYTMGVDGLIMQDLGAIRVVRQKWPDFPVHASTQLTANSLDDVLMLERLSIRTVVLSRELSLDEIQYIAERTNVRIESFIHGALCVSYSGQCLMSSVLGNRSGNRGKCAQNCRLNYRLLENERTLAAGHLLSTKDICTLSLLPELLAAGVSSLKIEGRMKTPEYVAGVTGIYRKYLDLCFDGKPYQIDPEDIRILQQLFNRGAFSTGYLKTHSGAEMMCPTHPRAWGAPLGKVISYNAQKHDAVIRVDRSVVAGDGIEIRTAQEEGIGCYIERSAVEGEKLTLRIEGPVRKDQDVYQTYDKRLMDRLKAGYEKVQRKNSISGVLSLHQGEASSLTVSCDGVSAAVYGDTPSAAVNQPLCESGVREQIRKLGSTIYRMDWLEISMDDNIYLNRSSLNALKNRAAAELTAKRIAACRRNEGWADEKPLAFASAPQRKTLSVLVRTHGQFETAMLYECVSMIYLEMNEALMNPLEELVSKAHDRGKKIAVRLPRIWREYIKNNTKAWLKKCADSPIDGWLISNLGHYHAVKDTEKSIDLDFTGNLVNSYSLAFWKELGIETAAVSVEMSRGEINGLSDRSKIEALVYGDIPLMVTHQCPIGNFVGKKRNQIHCEKRGHAEKYILQSDKGRFLLETDCRNCVCTIFSSDPLDIQEGINTIDAARFRLNFNQENEQEVRRIISRYEKLLRSGSSGSGRSDIYDSAVL